LVKISKKWGNLAFLLFLYLICLLLKSGKMLRPNFPWYCEKQVPFPKIEVLLMQKTQVYFFPVGGSGKNNLPLKGLFHKGQNAFQKNVEFCFNRKAFLLKGLSKTLFISI